MSVPSVKDNMEKYKDRFDGDLMQRNFFSDGIAVRSFEIPAGGTIIKHKHNYSHISILAEGKCTVRTDAYSIDNEIIPASEETYIAPTCINIQAGINHEVSAIEDVVWFCIHATDEKSADKVDEVTISR